MQALPCIIHLFSGRLDLCCSLWDLELQHVASFSFYSPVCGTPFYSPGNEPRPPVLGVWSPNHGTTREILALYLDCAGGSVIVPPVG